jgi:hypothetical protein
MVMKDIRFGKNTSHWLTAAALLTPLSMGSISAVQACASLAPSGGGERPVQVVDESAVILWDEQAKTEHFIRRARFDTDSPNIGFLVPTPTVPTVHKANDALFTAFEKALEPEVITTVKYGFRFGQLQMFEAHEESADGAPGPPGMPGAPGGPPGAPAVEVIREEKVGGYDVAVLAARDVDALNGWLKKNNYSSGPQLREWLQAYVVKGWNITAFKVAAINGQQIELPPVRLSFKTERPFYPYREPKPARPVNPSEQNAWAGRMLRVYFLSTERPEGTIGEKKLWPAETLWTAPLPAPAREALVEGTELQASLIPSATRLTAFDDRSYPRPATDELYFRPAADQSQIVPTPIRREVDARIFVPIELLLVGGGGLIGGTTVWVLKKRFKQ